MATFISNVMCLIAIGIVIYYEFFKTNPAKLSGLFNKEEKVDNTSSYDQIYKETVTGLRPNRSEQLNAFSLQLFDENYDRNCEVPVETIECTNEEFVKICEEKGYEIHGREAIIRQGYPHQDIDKNYFIKPSHELKKWFDMLKDIKRVRDVVAEWNCRDNSEVAKELIKLTYQEDNGQYKLFRPEVYKEIIKYFPYTYLFSDIDNLEIKLKEYLEKYRQLYYAYKTSTDDFLAISKGLLGEKEIQKYCAKITDKQIFGAIVPSETGNAENDIILFTKKGIFTIEVKNYSYGYLHVNKDYKIELKMGSNEIYTETENPIQQSKFHKSVLDRFYKERISRDNIHWLIAINNPKVKIDNESDCPILTAPFIASYIDQNYSDCLSDEDVEWAYKLTEEKKLPERKYKHTIINGYFRQFFN